MPDTVSRELRSKIMSRIKSKNTGPEMKVKRSLRQLGIIFKMHDRSIIGVPDISIKQLKIAVFIDGCFWHGCKKCCKTPKSNMLYWTNKIKRNQNRRKEVRLKLISDGWTVLEYWEHIINKNSLLIAKNIESAIRTRQ